MKGLRSTLSRWCLAALLAVGSAAPAMSASSTITASSFWDFYFRNQLTRLKREANGWQGEAQVPVYATIIPDVQVVRFEIASAALDAYAYDDDGRFSYLAAKAGSVGEAFEAVIDQSYAYAAPPPVGKERMAELFALIRSRYHLPAAEALSVARLNRTLSAMIAEHGDGLNQPIMALAWFLGEQGDRSSAIPLIEILRHSRLVASSVSPLHFTAVDAAFSALWKIDDKTQLPVLLALMRGADESGRRKIALLFEHLLSTTELLSLARCGDSYVDPDFWAKRIEPYRSYTAADWDRYDADALFWELRYRAATRLSPEDRPLLEKLANDEVGPVRAAAARNLGALPR